MRKEDILMSTALLLSKLEDKLEEAKEIFTDAMPYRVPEGHVPVPKKLSPKQVHKLSKLLSFDGHAQTTLQAFHELYLEQVIAE